RLSQSPMIAYLRREVGMKLLIGYDGSAAADAAIDDLIWAGLPSDAEASVVTAADIWPGLPADEEREVTASGVAVALPLTRQVMTMARRAIEGSEKTARRGADRVRALSPEWTVTSSAIADAPHHGLIERSEEYQPDLLVLGPHGKSALGRFFFGSVSQKVLNHVHCSVRIGRPWRSEPSQAGGGNPTSPLRLADKSQPILLVVGIDGSSDAAAAARALGCRTWPAGTEVRAVSVIDLRMMTLSATDNWMTQLSAADLDEDPPSRMRRAVRHVVHDLREAGLKATAVVREGDPKTVLVEEAKRCGAHCIFLGGRGLSALERFW